MIPPPRWRDIQGLVVSSYSHLDAATYILLRIEDPEAARAWLRRIAPLVTNAAEGADPDRRRALAAEGHVNHNLALSYSGLRKLHDVGLEPNFQRAFVEGIAGAEHRSRILGDCGRSSPDKWDWGGTVEPVDALLTLFGAHGDVVKEAVNSALAGNELRLVRPPLEALSLEKAGGREHFGFVDGISQPVLKGTATADRERDSQHLTELGEFVFGHRDGDGQVARGPALPGCPDFGINGSHLVFRQLRQHVKPFWDFVYHASRSPDGVEHAVAAAALASKIVGRSPDGTPLVPHGASDDNEFDFTDDPRGEGCPVGAHVRRANPRGSIALARLPAERANRHRLVRRSRLYGPQVAEAQRRRDDGHERGLLFLVLNADFERQFEFVNQNWINNSGFGGVQDERDPLIGTRDPVPNHFTIPGQPARVRVGPLADFVTVRGGEYFFLPGITALRYLAGLDECPK